MLQTNLITNFADEQAPKRGNNACDIVNKERLRYYPVVESGQFKSSRIVARTLTLDVYIPTLM